MKKFLTIMAIAVVTALGAFVLAAYYVTYSEGFRVGTVIKLSHKGYVFKTWEGQMDLGFLAPSEEQGTAAIATRLWNFSVRDSDVQVRQDIDRAIARNRRVKLHYEEKLWNISFWGDTKHFVDKVEVTE
jgi:hypothetical protein